MQRNNPSPKGRDAHWRYDHSPKGIEVEHRKRTSPLGRERQFKPGAAAVCALRGTAIIYALFDRPICELFQVAGANRSAKSSLFFSQSDVAFGS
jgi:hypothetical protein